MIDVSAFKKSVERSGRPWLIMGAGKTFDERANFDLQKFNLIALNDVVRAINCDIAYVKDLDVLGRCAQALIDNCRWVVMPRDCYENGFLNTSAPLDHRLGHPVLAELEKRGKLVVHDFQPLELAFRNYHSFSNISIAPNFYTSEAALTFLAEIGAKTVRSLGVEGGKKYAQCFADLEVQRFGRPPFDHQIDRLMQISAKFRIDYRALVEPMRIFIGTQHCQSIAAQVLRYTIHRYATAPVVVQEMDSLPVPVPRDESNRQRTGFSFYRFEIPKLTGYKGRALYVDADMQVFTDVGELWKISFGRQKVLCTYQELPSAWSDNAWAQPGRQYSVMLLDCERLKHWDMHQFVKDLDAGTFNYRNLLFDCCVVKPSEIEDRIPPEWNALEHWEQGKTKLIHYTVVPTQPWRAWNPLEHVWFSDYKRAIDDGWLTIADVEPLVEEGEARPILLTYFSNDSAFSPLRHAQPVLI